MDVQTVDHCVDVPFIQPPCAKGAEQVLHKLPEMMLRDAPPMMSVAERATAVGGGAAECRGKEIALHVAEVIHGSTFEKRLQVGIIQHAQIKFVNELCDAAFAALARMRWQPAIRVAPAWYDDPDRVETYYRAACSAWYDALDKAYVGAGSGTLAEGHFDRLCRLPDGSRYPCQPRLPSRP